MYEMGASQSSSPDYITGEEQAIQAGRREDGMRQTERVNPDAGRGGEGGRIPEAEAKRAQCCCQPGRIRRRAWASRGLCVAVLGRVGVFAI